MQSLLLTQTESESFCFLDFCTDADPVTLTVPFRCDPLALVDSLTPVECIHSQLVKEICLKSKNGFVDSVDVE
ncbi:hypothetical protein Tco_1312407 [Tanacetum coccineum]